MPNKYELLTVYPEKTDANSFNTLRDYVNGSSKNNSNNKKSDSNIQSKITAVTAIIVEALIENRGTKTKTKTKRKRKRKPNRIIIHVGTNDLKGNSNSDEVAKSIIDTNEVLVSRIVPRRDNLNGNRHLCLQSHLSYISNDNIRPSYHCNYGGIHKNNTGRKVLAENVKTLSQIMRFLKVSNKMSAEKLSKDKNSVSFNNIDDGNDDADISFDELKKVGSKHPKSIFLRHLTPSEANLNQ